MNGTEPARHAAGVAAAGFALAHLLSMPPDERDLDRLADPSGRASWPIDNEPTHAALDIIAGGFEADAVRAEWDRLLGGHPGGVELRASRRRGHDPAVLGATLSSRYAAAELSGDHVGLREPDHFGVELAFLAHLTARAAQAMRRGDHKATIGPLGDIAAFRVEHVDPVSDAVLGDLAARAETALLRALPGLVSGFLDELDALAVPTASGMAVR